MQISSLVSKTPARFAACALFGFLALGIATAPAGHQHLAAAGASTVVPSSPVNPNGVWGWD